MILGGPTLTCGGEGSRRVSITANVQQARKLASKLGAIETELAESQDGVN